MGQAKIKQSTRTLFEQRYQRLNKAQRQAVDAIEGVVMVMAGPGTGKTELLAMRVANIVKQSQMDPWNILCLTFTESGVAALRQRLLHIMGPAAYQVRVHTFHSFCHRVMQDHQEYFGWAKEFAAISELEQIQLYEDLLHQLPGTSKLKPFGNWQLFLPDMRRAISDLKQEGVSSDEFAVHLKELAVFVEQTEPIMDNFFALKPAERTPAVIEQFVSDVVHNKKDYQHLGFYFEYLVRLQSDYEQRAARVETGRAASALRTKYKNDVKRWFTSLTTNLTRQQELVGVYRAYQKALHERGQYDYEDMISLVTAEVRQNDSLLAHLQEQFQYLLVDEYQDTNGAQNELLFSLAEYVDEPNLFVVGDDKQSIYRFQGASLANLLSLYQRYGEQLTVVTLQENYRSPQVILDAADALIQYNEESIERHVLGGHRALTAVATTSSQLIAVQSYASVEAEQRGVIEQVQRCITNGTAPHEIAVIFRKNKDAHDFAAALRHHGLVAATQAESNVLQQPVVRQFVTLFTYLATAQDELLWQLAFYPWLKLDALLVLQAQTTARARRISLLAALKQDPVLRQFATKLASWRQQLITQTLPDSIAQLLTDSGLVTHLAKTDDTEALVAAGRLFAESKELARKKSAPTLADFLQHLRLLDEHGLTLAPAYAALPQQAVQVMTAHKAKGLEFKFVFIPQVTDHLWGNLRTRTGMRLPHGLVPNETVTLDSNEDERRLFYVALTRAKEQVTISHAEISSSGRPISPSEFIAELPAELVNHTTVDLVVDGIDMLLPKPVVSSQTRQVLVEHIKAGLAKYVMSVTHLNNYLRCPRLFYFRNILRVPAIKTKHMAFGTAAHAALRDLLAESRLNKAYLLKRFKHHLKNEFLTESDQQDSVDLGVVMLSRYFDHYKKRWNKNVLLEYNFASHGVEVAGTRITGMLDKIESTQKGLSRAKDSWPAGVRVNVVDYKTGNPDNSGPKLKPDGEYHRQLVFYQLLCDNAPRFEFEMVSGEIDFVQANRAGKFIKNKIIVSDDDIQQLTEQITEVSSKIHNLEFLKDGSACGECEYCQLA